METTIGGLGDETSPRWKGRLVRVHVPGTDGSEVFELGNRKPRDILRDTEASGTDIPVAHRSVSRRPHARVRFDPEVGNRDVRSGSFRVPQDVSGFAVSELEDLGAVRTR
ncbi:MAG: hypothetical protein AAFZ18_24145, partial [Myxococcota bacterium]